MPASDRPFPPLGESRDVRVMGGHWSIDLYDRATGRHQTAAQIRLLARDSLKLKASNRQKAGNAGGHDPAEVVHVRDDARRRSPFDGAEAIINGLVRVSLCQVTDNDRTVGSLLERPRRVNRELRIESAVAIEEQNIIYVGQAPESLIKSLIPSSSGGERPCRIKLDDRHSELACDVAAVVNR